MKVMSRAFIVIFLSILFGCSQAANYTQASSNTHKETKKVILLSGKKSHAHGHHENNAGISVLENLLQRQTKAHFDTSKFLNGDWPEQSELERADAIVVMSDGDNKHILKDRMVEFDLLIKNNPKLGLLFIHYATVPEGRKNPEFKGGYFNDWIGGFYAGDSSNKTLTRWTHVQSKLSTHPINNGVAPYTIFDEIYYRMSYVDGIDPIVVVEEAHEEPHFRTDLEKARYERDRTKISNFRNELERTVFWGFEREGGGRSVGTTMGHIHKNFWTTEGVRKQMVNSVAWAAQIEVPEDGFDALFLTEAQLKLNHSLPRGHREKGSKVH